MKADAVFGPSTGFYCGYAFAPVSANRASLERINTWVSGEYELNDDITFTPMPFFLRPSLLVDTRRLQRPEHRSLVMRATTLESNLRLLPLDRHRFPRQRGQ